MFGEAERGTSAMPEKAHSLRGIRILSDLAPRELALLAAECAWRTFARDDIIMSPSQDAARGEILFVAYGSVRLARPTGPNGRIVYRDIAAGGQFGEMSLFGIDETDMAAVARDETLLAAMPEQRFLQLLAREESVSRSLLCQYARLLREREAAGAAETRADGATDTQRLYAELLALAEPRPSMSLPGEDRTGSLFIARLPRHRELADRLSITEQIVAAAIADLVRMDIAEREYPGLVIKDEAALRRLCEER